MAGGGVSSNRGNLFLQSRQADAGDDFGGPVEYANVKSEDTKGDVNPPPPPYGYN